VGSLQTANHPRDQNMRKRQLFYFILFVQELAAETSGGLGGDDTQLDGDDGRRNNHDPTDNATCIVLGADSEPRPGVENPIPAQSDLPTELDDLTRKQYRSVTLTIPVSTVLCQLSPARYVSLYKYNFPLSDT
jgi:hypothetical protein